MRARLLLSLACVAAIAASLQAQAQETPAACASVVAPTGPLAPWNNPTKGNAASKPAAAHTAKLKIGQATELTLLPTSAVTYSAMPMKPGEEGSFGGLASFQVKQAGIYRIALGAAAWIDVASGGSTIASETHSHGPACSGVRKMVDFTLAPGRYALQLSGSRAASIQVLIIGAP